MKPTPRKENKVLKFLNDKVVQPIANTADKYIVKPVDKYIVKPVTKGVEVLSDTIIKPVSNMIDNSIAQNNKQHEKNQENSKKNQEAIKNYVKQAGALQMEAVHNETEGVLKTGELVKDLNPVTGLIAINNFFVKLEDMRVEYVRDTYDIAKDPDKYSPYAYGAYGAGQYKRIS